MIIESMLVLTMSSYLFIIAKLYHLDYKIRGCLERLDKLNGKH